MRPLFSRARAPIKWVTTFISAATGITERRKAKLRIAQLLGEPMMRWLWPHCRVGKVDAEWLGYPCFWFHSKESFTTVSVREDHVVVNENLKAETGASSIYQLYYADPAFTETFAAATARFRMGCMLYWVWDSFIMMVALGAVLGMLALGIYGLATLASLLTL